MRRGASRGLALVALLGAGVAVVLIVLGHRGGGGDGSSAAGAARGLTRPARGSGAVRPTVVAGTAVRNARPQPDWRPYSGPVPILRYHVVGTASRQEPYSELFVPPADFAAQMDWLADHGYEAVRLDAVQRAWSAGGTLPTKPIVISFDGVRGDLLRVAEPELRRRGWPGVLVLDPERPPARATAVAKLVAAGWELEAEGAAPGRARRALEARFATAVPNFAFPQDRFEAARIPSLKAAGFRGATATGYGFAESREPFDLPRITVFGLSRIQGFAEAMQSRGGGVGA